MTDTPSFGQRRRDIGYLWRLRMDSWGSLPMKKYSLALLIDEFELASLGFQHFKMVKELALPPVQRNRSDPKSFEVPGITAQRTFKSQDSFTELVVRATPYPSEEIAIDRVLHADETMMLNPMRKIEIVERRAIEEFQIDGLPTIHAHEERLKTRGGTESIRLIVSNVDRVLFSLHINSRGGYCSWEELSSVAVFQAGKIRAKADF